MSRFLSWGLEDSIYVVIGMFAGAFWWDVWKLVRATTRKLNAREADSHGKQR